MTFKCSRTSVQNGSIWVRSEAGLVLTVFLSIWGTIGWLRLFFISIVGHLAIFFLSWIFLLLFLYSWFSFLFSLLKSIWMTGFSIWVHFRQKLSESKLMHFSIEVFIALTGTALIFSILYSFQTRGKLSFIHPFIHFIGLSYLLSSYYVPGSVLVGRWFPRNKWA